MGEIRPKRCEGRELTKDQLVSHHPSNNKPRSRLYIYRAGGKAGEVRTVESTTCLLDELDAKNASSFAFIDSVAFCSHTDTRFFS